MKRFIAALILLSFASPLLYAQDTNEEAKLIAVLQSTNSLTEKDAACASLKRIGTKQSVPELEKLLTDNDLSHSARYALESMTGSTANEALIRALTKTSGSNEVGIINSLGLRREKASVTPLAQALSNSDPLVACAAAEALGRIGGSDAVSQLEKAASASTSAIHQADVDGLLECANTYLTENRHKQALRIFQNIYKTETDEAIRLAAFRGVILSSGSGGIKLMADAITGSDDSTQGAALLLAVKLPGAKTTATLAGLLSKVQPPVQIALLQALAQRNDPAAAAAIAPLLDSDGANVRMAAITALGNLGDGSVVRALALKAASGSGEEKAAARDSLLVLHHGDIAAALMALADEPAARLEVIRTLGDRGEKSAAPKLLELARSTDDSIRSAAFQSLALVAGPAQIPILVQMIVKASDDDSRSVAAEALGAVCQHIKSPDVQPLVEAVQSGPLEARLALLPVCSGLTNLSTRTAMRAALNDSEPRVREAAIRALGQTRDPELLPDLLQVAAGAEKEKFRVLAVRGCVQLVTREDVKLPTAAKVDALKKVLDAPLDVAEKRLVLSGLGPMADEGALALAVPLLDDSSVQKEAADAVIQIAGSIARVHPAEASAALKKVMASTTDASTKKLAAQALKKVHKF